MSHERPRLTPSEPGNLPGSRRRAAHFANRPRRAAQPADVQHGELHQMRRDTTTSDAHVPAFVREPRRSPADGRNARGRYSVRMTSRTRDPGGGRRTPSGHRPSRAQALCRRTGAALFFAIGLVLPSVVRADDVGTSGGSYADSSATAAARSTPPPLCMASATAEVTPCGTSFITRQSVTRSVTFRVGRAGRPAGRKPTVSRTLPTRGA